MKREKLEQLISLCGVTEEKLIEFGFMKEKRKLLYTRLEKNEHEKLIKLSHERELSMSELVCTYIDKHLDGTKKIKIRKLDKIKKENQVVFTLSVQESKAKEIKHECKKSYIYVSSFLRLIIDNILSEGT